MITPPIAGLMIDLLEPHSDAIGIAHAGYKSIFLLSSSLLLLAVVLVKKIRVSNVCLTPPPLLRFPPRPRILNHGLTLRQVEELRIGVEEDGTVGHELQTPLERRAD